MKNYQRKIMTYTLLILLSIIPTIVMFNNGFIAGHDNQFHYAQIQDLFNAWKNKHYSYYLNYQANHYFGMGVKLMYAPFSHLITVIVGFAILPFGLSLTTAMKIVIYFSILLSGIFTYHLLKKITKNELASFVGAAFYMLFPYRFTDIYIRNAFAETIAMAFIPLVFNGVYSLLKIENFSIKPFFITIAGVVLVFMTHNITAIYTFVFTAIFVIFLCKDLLRQIKKPWFWLGCFVSLLLMICLMSPLMFPLLEHKALGIYRIFDPEAMNTNLLQVTNEVDRSFAFLNAGAAADWIKNLIFFILLNVTGFLFLEFSKIYLQDKRTSNLILAIVGCIPLAITLGFSVYSSIALIIYITLFIEIALYLIPFKNSMKEDKISIPIILCFTLLFAISIILTTTKFLWQYVPDFFYTIQFAWRLWVFVGFFGGILIALLMNILLKHQCKPATKLFAVATACCLVVVIRPTTSTSYPTSVDNSISDEFTYPIHAAGWQCEYFPINFFQGKKSTYWWQCYFMMNEKNDSKIDEVGIYKGYALQSNYLYDEGMITFRLDTKSSSVTIQLPRVYYLGYQITLTTEDNIVHTLEPLQIQSLLSFTTSLSGNVKVEYVGTKLMNLSSVLFWTASGIIFITPAVYFMLQKKET